MTKLISRTGRYSLAFAATAAALAVNWLLEPLCGQGCAISLLFAAVGFTVWLGGAGPAAAVAVTGYVASYLLFLPPGFSGTPDAGYAVAFLIYASSCAVVIGVGEALHRARSRAAATNDLLNDAVNGARMVAWEWSPDEKRLTVTANAQEFFGLSGPLTLEDLSNIHPEDRETHEEQVRQALKSTRGYHCVYRFIRPRDGRIIWVEDTGRIFRNAAGRATRVTGVSVDISDRSRMEDLLFHRAEELRAVARRRSEFMTVLAHELRNPLAAIRTALHLIKISDADERIIEPRRIAERQVAQVVRMIDDLMDISRIDQDKLDLRYETVAVNDIVLDAVDTARPNAELQKQQIHVEMGDKPLYIEADAVRMTQVISNLLTNASKFSARGGRIWLVVRELDNEAVISVRDEGFGIAADRIDSIFGRFVQLGRAGQREAGGLGLGLALVKTFVELHQGTVSAASEGEGRGAQFTVKLPLAIPPVPRETPAAAAVDAAPRNRIRRVLVADDNLDALQSTAALLSHWGHQVYTADDGRSALLNAAMFAPDVMVLDIGMPGLSGYDTARQIRREPWGRNVLLIALTGYGQPEDRRSSLEAGFDIHLVKPVDPDELERIVERGER